MEHLNESISNHSTTEMVHIFCNCPRPAYIPTVVEYNKALGGYDTGFMTVGSILSLLLYALFFRQLYFTYANAHKAYRRHIYWLISIYPLVTLMSTLALVVPRAHGICSAVKITYMCIGVGHFVDLTILMFGSESKLAEAVSGRQLQLNVLPLCCCMPCIPKPLTSKKRLRFIKWMIWQMKYTQALYYFCVVFARFSQEDSDGAVQSKIYSYVLTVFNFVSFLSGVYALNIISKLVDRDFSEYRYRLKSLMLKILIVTTKLQSFVFNVLAISGVFPCLNEYITPVVYENTVENWTLILEMLVFGFISYSLYSKKEFQDFPVFDPALSKKDSLILQEPSALNDPALTETAPSQRPLIRSDPPILQEDTPNSLV